MSENLNRSNPDFSKYDSMSIGELEEILRADAQGPERDDSDVDEILYVMEVLAKKRRQNGIAGKTALEAYQEFQQHYRPVVEKESSPKRKSNIIPFQRIAAIAASLVLVFSLATSANAFGWKDIWNAVARWAEETFSISVGVEASFPRVDDTYEYTTFYDILSQNGRNPNLVPQDLPSEYDLTDVVIDKTPKQETFLAVYTNNNTIIKISVQSFLCGYPEQVEMSEGFQEIYSRNGIDYYIFCNHNQNQVVWIVDEYECYISGAVSVDALKNLIDSIEKG